MSAFYKGVFERMEDSGWFFCGQNVVKCVVIVERKRHFGWGGKYATS
jgi:hypothetical protein